MSAITACPVAGLENVTADRQFGSYLAAISTDGRADERTGYIEWPAPGDDDGVEVWDAWHGWISRHKRDWTRAFRWLAEHGVPRGYDDGEGPGHDGARRVEFLLV
ncbi:hypothetical protein [Nakamurella leprariae]|uniref:Uncharacterized protein n=1 Tax=Nakamurella leprariae TaxID=2803911 RepID=A0A938YHB9_9ACTN|nr:hypothetical protein [Nakamurella leprariae]MBM9469506.1 hypothetical protein [Nakamurella leprariae]